MTDTKKKWVKPELTVLLRSRPEEAVLVACKREGLGGDPGVLVFICGSKDGVCGTECAVRSDS